MSPKKVCIVGSGNWGMVIAKIIGNNVQNTKDFETSVSMYVFEEMVEGRKLTEIINTDHENTKYLPGHKVPANVVAIPDVIEAASDADVLVFVLPHQFMKNICKTLKGKVKESAVGITLIKGLDITEAGLDLISNMIRRELSIPCAVLMGANIASEVARENYCEATIGCKDKDIGNTFKDLMQTPYFRIVVVEDEATVELCGALKDVMEIAAGIADALDMIANTKAAVVRLGIFEYQLLLLKLVIPNIVNIVAVGAGFTEGLGFGDNTKAAVIRLGLMEMVKFIEEFFGQSKIETFLESCGIADLVTTCYSGRNRRCAEAYVRQYPKKSLKEIEIEMLDGQSLQGPITAAEVNHMLRKNNLENRFPIFTAVHYICVGDLSPTRFIDCLRDHPEHM
ncbi:DgyrCDS10058 [Dimorphilus gyrociliatus]|uniref:Glycerol-3-phosphate dehydrogenase [NAD(+)] n=1 Tax=Dimorphilus gyrociliatus TaxID=2664684 RepID=A0A7I8VZA9_9ANNE|nr:DgyrCDS10058 [Dimorphilus gyrociliatus]